MKHMSSKFIKELPELVREEVISVETSGRISAYYSEKKDQSPNRLMTIFGVLGSVLIGLGIILMIAHNWDDLSKSIKTMFAFIPLLMGQVAVGFSILKKKSAVWKEASGTFLFFAVGSGMALISQIYNIPGDFSNYLLTWVLLCVPLVYLLKSNALWVLNLVFISYYACEYGFGSQNMPLMYLAIIIGLLPFYLLKIKNDHLSNLVAVISWLLPLSLITVLGAFIKTEWELLPLLYLLLFSTLYLLGKLPFLVNEQLRKNGYLVIGSIGAVVLLLLFSFKWIFKELITRVSFSSEEFIIAILLFVISTVVFVYNRKRIKKEGFNLFLYIGVLFPMMCLIGEVSVNAAVIGVNVLVFLLGLTTIKKGIDQHHFGISNYGLLILSSLIVCRFFDTNIGFELKGLLFVLIGVGFFVVNYMMLKRIVKK